MNKKIGSCERDEREQDVRERASGLARMAKRSRMQVVRKKRAHSHLTDFITILIIQLVLTLPFYTVSVYGLTISNVRVAKVTSSSATIEWGTDNISNGRVRYGATTALGFTQRHDNFIGNHTAALFNGIDSDTKYFFAVESTDLAGNTAIDNNSNSLYTFKTTDITPPPQVTGLRLISVASNLIFLSWNNLNISDLKHYLIYRNRILIGNSTTNRFNDTGLSSNTGFSYKVSAVDNSSNEGPQSDTLIASTSAVDSTSPVISNIDVITITDTTARVTWLTNENATTIVLYGVNKTDKIKSSNDLEINHTIIIDGLVKNVKHIFVVKSCDASDNCANSSVQSFVAGRDTKAPFINLSIPRFVNRRVIDIIGSTEPFSSVTLFVNNMNVPKRSLSSNEVGASGKFAFSQIQLEQDNVIKLVFVDKSGNKNQKIFEVSIDTEDPILQLSDIPTLTSKSELAISGHVNEPVTIKVFVDANINESSIPSRVTGLNVTKIGQNSVELGWDELKDKDFSHYVVYRADASPIAITKPANFNLFIDALVDSGRSYTYEVSAVNIFAREGPKSDPITATTLKGGAILNLKPPEVDIFEDFRKPLLVTNASGSFNFVIKLNRGDGTYKIKIIFEDRADNSIIIDKSVTLDTKKSEVKIISPPSGALIFENLANEVDVIGKTKPNARVHLFVDRTPFSLFNESFEISGLPNEIQDLPEAKLDAKCRSSISASFCRTGADLSVSADSQGNFKFERVDLTAGFFLVGGGAARFREVPVTEFRDTQLNPEAQESKRTTLVVIATDATGQRGVASQTVRIGTCWSGNQSWDTIPLMQYQSPTFLSTERLAEGTETIYFYLNYSYVGSGTNAKITTVSMRKACGNRELLDPRFNLSCQLLGGVPAILVNPPDNTISYTAATLSRLPGMDRFLEKDWKAFFKSLNKELTFPVHVTIKYQHDKDNDGKLESEVQTTCEQVSYALDNSIIDFRNVLPDWLLFDFVDLLQDSIKTITDIQEKLNKVLEFITIGCVTSFGLVFIVGAYRRIVEFTDEKTYMFLAAAKDINEGVSKLTEIFQKNPLKTANDKEDERTYCKDLIQKIYQEKKSLKLKYLSDDDLRKCFPNSASAWKAEENVYKSMRYTCDRIFGHSSPAGWTEDKKDADIQAKISSASGCAVDQAERGQPLRFTSCRELPLSQYGLKPNDFEVDDKCYELRVDNPSGGFRRILLQLGQHVQGTTNIYEVTQKTKDREVEIRFAKKLNENNYLTAAQRTCEELCGIKQAGKEEVIILENERIGLNPKEVPKTLKPGEQPKKPKKTGFGCLTVDKCRGLNQNKKIGNEEIEYAFPVGYANSVSDQLKRPCFYNGERLSVISDSPAEREECCCINTKGEIITHYYQPNDIYAIKGLEKIPVHEAKTESVATTAQEPTTLSQDDFAKMKWSYRYYKEKFVAVNPKNPSVDRYEYNPNRYMEGKDWPACFGQNSWWDGKNVVIVNPSRDHLASLQCINLGGISARLQFIKNLMTHLSSCLVQVRTTGRGDTGTCKELFSQYICSGIWQALRWLIDGCSPFAFDYGKQIQDADIIEYLAKGLKGAHDSASDLRRTIESEYGNAKLNELLGFGEESLARKLCLLAFGYDWEFDFKSFVDAAYTTPFATLVQPVTRSREFLTVEPGTSKPKYEYRASWLVNPGCDFERYEVWLSCVGKQQLDKYPNSVNCAALGAPSVGYTVPVTQPIGPLGGPSTAFSQCDCINLNDEKRELVFAGKLKQNVLEDNVIPSGKRILTHDVRFDHLKFVLKPDRKIPTNVKSNCFQTGFDDGVFYFPLIDKTARDILDCQADLTQGLFLCKGGQTFTAKKGTASFLDLRINTIDAITRKEELVFNPGDSLSIEATIRNVGEPKCLRATLEGKSEAIPIDFEGQYQYGLTFIKPLTIGNLQQIQVRPEITVQDAGSANTEEVFIEIRFYDDGNEIIEFDKDWIMVDGKPVDKDTLVNQRIITINEGDRTKEVQVSLDENNKLKLKKNNADVIVISADIPRDSRGQTFKAPIPKEIAEKEGKNEAPSVSGTIKILSAARLNELSQTQQSTTKRLVVALYNSKGDPKTLPFPDYCDWSSIVTYPTGGQAKQDITIKVEQKVADTGIRPPLITLKKKPSNVINLEQIKEPLTVSAEILHRDGIRFAEMKCTTLDEQEIRVPAEAKPSNIYDFTISKDQITQGKYNCEIIAESSNGKTNSQKGIDFEIK